jgi:hypothetical protein
VLVLLNKFIKKKLFKIINNTFLLIILILFILDMFTSYYFQSRVSILDIPQFLSPSEGSFGGIAAVILAIISL